MKELTRMSATNLTVATQYSNDIYLDPALFARVKVVYENPGKLTVEQQQVLEKTYRGFVNSGANNIRCDYRD